MLELAIIIVPRELKHVRKGIIIIRNKLQLNDRRNIVA
jgi:hypothetical protein